MTSQDVGYSYRRFSSLPQESGDSVRRQTSKTEAWSERTGVPIDWSLRIDKGLSGYTMENLDVGSLGEFVKLVEKGKVKRGSYLVVESLDRLTRGFEQDALRVILNLTGAGVRIVQLEPHESVFDAKSESWDIMRLIMDLMRGHQDSKRKSGMIKADRENKRAQARKGVKVAQRHPSWLRLVGQRFEEVEPQASVVRRMKALALSGRGTLAIARALNADGVPPFGKGRSGRWSSNSVNRILTDGRAAGWFQPCGADRTPDGPPVEGYYPRLMSQKDLERIRALVARRKGKGGRDGSAVINLFAHLVRDASTGQPMQLSSSVSVKNGRRSRYLLLQCPPDLVGGHPPTVSYLPFEYALLACLAELPAALAARESPEDDPDALRGQLAAMEKQQASLIADVLEADSPTLRAAAKALDARMAEAQRKLEAALRSMATAAADALEDAKEIIGRLYGCDDPRAERRRLREALRSLVERIDVVVVPRGVARLVAAQVRLSSGRVRSYIVGTRRAVAAYRAAKQRAKVSYGSLFTDGAGDVPDLRDPAEAAEVRRQLEEVPLDQLPWMDLPEEVR